MKRNYFGKIIGLMVVASLVFIACSKNQNSSDAKKAELSKLKAQSIDIQNKISALEKELASMSGTTTGNNTVTVNIEEIKAEQFKRFFEVQGQLESQRAASVSSKVPGTVAKIHVSNGDMVKKGQLLIEVDDETYKKGLEELENSYNFANTVFEKQQRLWEKKVGSEIQYLQAKNTKESLEKRLTTVKQQLSDTKIYAAFDGVVDEITPKVGEAIMPGFPVLKLTSMSDVFVSAEVSETYLNSVKSGDVCILKFADINEKIDSRISVASKVISTKNRTFRVEAKLPKIFSGMKPNMNCSISINDITKNNAILAPIKVIQKSADKEYLFIAVDESGLKAKKRFVKTGLSYDGHVEILEGLSSGDKIIIEGCFDVADGQSLVTK
ncbi:MAG: efflux RND transporter periplasmic adaptor subunit [Candidatus Kapabacteria bacterium]|nr:efflux RND transporter periplasmic adaptor subunit [Candidatus Kapabacteria bacterium]